MVGFISLVIIRGPTTTPTLYFTAAQTETGTDRASKEKSTL